MNFSVDAISMCLDELSVRVSILQSDRMQWPHSMSYGNVPLPPLARVHTHTEWNQIILILRLKWVKFDGRFALHLSLFVWHFVENCFVIGQ